MNTVNWNGKTITYPSTWDECTSNDLMAIAATLGFFRPEDGDEIILNERAIIMIQHFLKIKKEKLLAIDAAQMVDFYPTIEFIFTEPDIKHQPLPDFRLFFTRYHGPKAALKTSTFDEFIMADTAFMKFCKTGNHESLYELAAIMYRPRRKDWKEFKSSEEYNSDVREPFNPEVAKERAKHFQKWLNMYTAFVVFYFYWGFRNVSLLKYKTLFKEPAEGESQQPAKYGWAATRFEISGEKFGDFRKTGKEPWENIIFDLHRMEENRIIAEAKAAFERQNAGVK
jgi:hypothetical protein